MAPGWTQEDKARLFAFVEQFGAGNWTAAEKHVPGKTGKQVSDSIRVMIAFHLKLTASYSVS